MFVDEFAFDQCRTLSDVYYGGTQADWENIEFAYNGYQNDELIKANIHYSNPFSPSDISIGEPEISEDMLTFTVSASEERTHELKRLMLFVAEYDGGALVNVYKGINGQAENGVMRITAEAPESDNYKIFLWDKNQCPLMSALTDIY